MAIFSTGEGSSWGREEDTRERIPESRREKAATLTPDHDSTPFRAGSNFAASRTCSQAQSFPTPVPQHRVRQHRYRQRGPFSCRQQLCCLTHMLSSTVIFNTGTTTPGTTNRYRQRGPFSSTIIFRFSRGNGTPSSLSPSLVFSSPTSSPSSLWSASASRASTSAWAPGPSASLAFQSTSSRPASLSSRRCSLSSHRLCRLLLSPWIGHVSSLEVSWLLDWRTMCSWADACITARSLRSLFCWWTRLQLQKLKETSIKLPGARHHARVFVNRWGRTPFGA